MDFERQTHACRWATPTLFLDFPYWLDASTWPWSCSPDGRLRLLSSSEICRQCANWIQRTPEDKPAEFSGNEAILKA